MNRKITAINCTETCGSEPLTCVELVTAFIIKPDATPYRMEILQALGNDAIISYEEKPLDEDAFSTIYSFVKGERHYQGLREYLTEGVCGFGIIYGKSIETVRRITGTNTIPAECEPGTIRNLYGRGPGHTLSGKPVIRNAIHRPKDERQNSVLIELIESGTAEMFR